MQGRPSAAGGPALDAIPLFENLDPAARADLAKAATSRQLPVGAVLLEQGDQPRWLHLIARGRIKIGHTTPDGTPLTLRFLGPGELVGCAAVFRKIPYPATATAVAESVVTSWSAGEIETLMTRYPQLAKNALAAVSGRAEEMLRRARDFATQRVEQRIAGALLGLTREAGRRVEAGVEVDFPLSRQDLAELAGATLYTVSRTLSAWAAEGLLETGRRRVVVRDLARLSEIAAREQP